MNIEQLITDARKDQETCQGEFIVRPTSDPLMKELAYVTDPGSDYEATHVVAEMEFHHAEGLARMLNRHRELAEALERTRAELASMTAARAQGQPQGGAMKTRATIARKNAGLSIAQAARLLDMSVDEVRTTEVYDEACVMYGTRLCDVYRVNLEWLLGEVPRCDYARVDAIANADILSQRDRQIIAQSIASMPRPAIPKDQAEAHARAAERRNSGGD